MEPRFLTVAEVLAIHHDQITRYGGEPGILNQHLLESAVAQPQATFDGKHLLPDLHEMAAAYLLHLVKNHPFNDGNKRVAAATALVFLTLNGIQPTLTNDQLVQLVLDAATSRLHRDQIADYLRTHTALNCTHAPLRHPPANYRPDQHL